MSRVYTEEQKNALVQRGAKYAMQALRGFFDTVGLEYTDVFVLATTSWRYQSGDTSAHSATVFNGCPNCMSSKAGQHIIDVTSDSLIRMRALQHVGDHPASDG